MNRWAGKVAVVTGASAGIGLSTCKALVRNGLVVVGLARRKAKMEEEMKNVDGQGEFHAVECDISLEDNVVKTFDYIKKQYGRVHVLVNNAGMVAIGSTVDISTEKLRQIVDLNIMGLLYCTRQAVSMMKEGYEAHIVNVGSVLGHKLVFVKDLDCNVYPATKFAIRALSETMQHELQQYPIRFTHISPGVVKTEMFEKARSEASSLEDWVILNSEDVADAIVYAIGTKPHVCISEITLRHVQDRFR